MERYRQDVKLWTRGQHKLDPTKVAAKILSDGFNSYPDIKERARQECNQERLDAKEWREHVDRKTHVAHRWNKHRKLYADWLADHKAMHDTLKTVEALKLSRELGLPEDKAGIEGLKATTLGASAEDAVLARAAERNKDTFKPEPKAPKVAKGHETDADSEGLGASRATVVSLWIVSLNRVRPVQSFICLLPNRFRSKDARKKRSLPESASASA